MNILQKYYPSTDGVHQLYTKIYLPDGTPKGIFHVVHGMTEYIDRYEDLFRFLCENGYVAVGYDHVGHGHTAKNAEELGFIAHRGGDQVLVDDVIAFSEQMKKEYPDLPYYLLGHSMGSFIVRLASMKGHPEDKLIVMGTGGPNPVSGMGLFIADLIRLFKGERYRSPFMDKMAFGSYGKRFASENDKRSWLNTQKKARDAYGADSLCTYRFTISAMHDLISLQSGCNSAKWFDVMSDGRPILLVSGDEDPVGDYGRGVRKVYDGLMEQNGNVAMKLYPSMRHEILNDVCADEVKQDILAFITD